MKFPTVILLGAALYLFSSTEAGISTNSPYKDITWNAGQSVKVIWTDDGTAPTLDQIGDTTIDLMAGGNSIQVLVSNIGTTKAIAKEIDYTVPTNIGPPGNNYFIKYTAGTYTSFSGTFTITGTSGELGEAPVTKAPPTPVNNTATPAAPTPLISTTPKTDDPDASPSGTKVNLPSSLSDSAAANLLPSFAGIATAAVALTITYLF